MGSASYGKVEKTSLDSSSENIANLRKLFPQAVTEGKIDFDRLKLLLKGEIATDEKYSFSWAGRKEAFRNIQTTAKGTLVADKKESVDFDTTENVFIEGDNLEVLKLLQKAYFEKVKMTYIDPPYNTGKDFVYKDDFKDSIKGYLEQTGQMKDGLKLTTNPQSNGRFHSDWLTMMYPRLFIARNLLKEDGVIFISIDDNEVHNLRMIMNEIFGEENFVAQLIWRKKAGGGNDSQDIAVEHEYIIVYRKEKNGISKLPLGEETLKNYKYKDEKIKTHGPYSLKDLNDPSLSDSKGLHYDIKCPDGKYLKAGENQWKCNKDTFEKRLTENRIIFKKIKDRWKVFYKIYLNEEKGELKYDEKGNAIAKGRNLSSILYTTALNKRGNDELKKIFGDMAVFDYPKPTPLISTLIQTAAGKEDIILDFFAGSGTTAHAVLDLNKSDEGNRKFICVQLPERTDEDSEAFKAGYKSIADITKERIRRAIASIEKEEKGKLVKKEMGLGFKVFKLSQSNYKIWQEYEGKDEKELLKQMELFKSPLVKGFKAEDVIYECLIKEGYSLNAKITQVSVKENKVYRVEDKGSKENEAHGFFICLDSEINLKTIDALKLKKDSLFICLDEALDDSKKANLAKQCNLKVI